jgi:hypothetical protein
MERTARCIPPTYGKQRWKDRQKNRPALLLFGCLLERELYLDGESLLIFALFSSRFSELVLLAADA